MALELIAKDSLTIVFQECDIGTLLKTRYVCRSYNEIAKAELDKRWIAIAQAIADRTWGPTDLKDPLSCLNSIKIFFVQLQTYFPYPKRVVTKLLDTIKDSGRFPQEITANPPPYFERIVPSDIDPQTLLKCFEISRITKKSLVVDLDVLLGTNHSSPPMVDTILKIMDLRGQKPGKLALCITAKQNTDCFSRLLELVDTFDIAPALENGMSRASLVKYLDWLEKKQLAPQEKMLEHALETFPLDVERILKMMQKKSVALDEQIIYKVMRRCPENLPFALQLTNADDLPKMRFHLLRALNEVDSSKAEEILETLASKNFKFNDEDALRAARARASYLLSMAKMTEPLDINTISHCIHLAPTHSAELIDLMESRKIPPNNALATAVLDAAPNQFSRVLKAMEKASIEPDDGLLFSAIDTPFLKDLLFMKKTFDDSLSLYFSQNPLAFGLLVDTIIEKKAAPDDVLLDYAIKQCPNRVLELLQLVEMHKVPLRAGTISQILSHCPQHLPLALRRFDWSQLNELAQRKFLQNVIQLHAQYLPQVIDSMQKTGHLSPDCASDIFCYCPNHLPQFVKAIKMKGNDLSYLGYRLKSLLEDNLVYPTKAKLLLECLSILELQD